MRFKTNHYCHSNEAPITDDVLWAKNDVENPLLLTDLSFHILSSSSRLILAHKTSISEGLLGFPFLPRAGRGATAEDGVEY